MERVGKDKKKAEKLYLLAAENKSSFAKINLGLIHNVGSSTQAKKSHVLSLLASSYFQSVRKKIFFKSFLNNELN